LYRDLGYKVPAAEVLTPLLPILGLREGDGVNESLLARGLTMHMSTIDAHRIANLRGKDRLRRIVNTKSIDGLRWLAMGVIVLATASLFLTDDTHRTSIVELLLMWSLVLLSI
jgi:hypothetical protein